MIEKWKIAQIVGISERTLRRMFNAIFYEDLKNKGYRKYQKKIPLDIAQFYFPDIDFSELVN